MGPMFDSNSPPGPYDVTPLPPPVLQRDPLRRLGIAGILSGAFFCLVSVATLALAAHFDQGPASASGTATTSLSATTQTSPPTSQPASTVTTQPASTSTSSSPTTEQQTGTSATEFTDDFSTMNGGWFVGSTGQYAANYTPKQAYAMGIETPRFFFVSLLPNPFPEPIQDAAVSVRGKMSPGDTGEFGISCRYRDADNCYLAVITGDSFYVGKRVAGTWSYLTAPNLVPLPSTTVDADGYLVLRLTCVASSIVFEVNGIEVGRFTDDQLTAGDVGLYIWGGDQLGPSGYYAQAIFDDFSVALQ
jgi:hypothetical protein